MKITNLTFNQVRKYADMFGATVKQESGAYILVTSKKTYKYISLKRAVEILNKNVDTGLLF